MNVNPAQIALIAANNANIARMNALRAQWEAEDAAERAVARLAELERQHEIERQEHAWAIELIQRGQSASSAKSEASTETRRQAIYSRLSADLENMRRYQPREGSRGEYDREIARRRKEIESRRTKTIFGPHPLVISMIFFAILTLGTWLTVNGSPAQRGAATAVAAIVAVVAVVLLRDRLRRVWAWYRTRAVAKADERAKQAIFNLPGFAKWKYDKFVVDSKPFWAAQGHAFHDRDQLKFLGKSLVDSSMYRRMIKSADQLLTGTSTTEVSLHFAAIEECIYAGQFGSAETMIAELSTDGQNHYRRFLRDVRDGREIQPSKVSGLEARFFDDMLHVSWGRPTRHPDAVSSYVVHIAQQGSSIAWTFETAELSLDFQVHDLRPDVIYSVCVEVKSEGKSCGRGKPVTARSAARASTSHMPNPLATPKASNSRHALPAPQVPNLKAKFFGETLYVSWGRPTRQPGTVSSYVVHVTRQGTSDEWAFETSELSGKFDLHNLLPDVNYSVCVEVKSEGKSCGRGKPVTARSAARASSSHVPNLSATPKAANSPCALRAAPLPSGYKFCPLCGTDHS